MRLSSVPGLKDKGTGGAGIHTLAAITAGKFTNRLVTESGNYPFEAAMGKIKNPHTLMLPAYPDTPSAEHTLVGVVDEVGVAGIHRTTTPVEILTAAHATNCVEPETPLPRGSARVTATSKMPGGSN